jgi:hypothetical protein
LHFRPCKTIYRRKVSRFRNKTGPSLIRQTVLSRRATIGKSFIFVPVCKPHLYQVLNRYRFSSINDGAHLYRVESHPGTNVFCPRTLLSSLPSSFYFLFSSHLTHLISYTSHNHKNNNTNTRFTSHLISSHHDILISSHNSTTISFYTNIQLICITIFTEQRTKKKKRRRKETCPGHLAPPLAGASPSRPASVKATATSPASRPCPPHAGGREPHARVSCPPRADGREPRAGRPRPPRAGRRQPQAPCRPTRLLPRPSV